MAKTEKRKKGDEGERVAFSYLKKNGYKILDRNYANRFGEIDIVAFKPFGDILSKVVGGKQRGTVVFVEVKTRKVDFEGVKPLQTGSELYPERNVDWRKQRKLVRAAGYYLIKNKYHEDAPWQIDVIGIELDKARHLANLRHIKNAVGGV